MADERAKAQPSIMAIADRCEAENRFRRKMYGLLAAVRPRGKRQKKQDVSFHNWAETRLALAADGHHLQATGAATFDHLAGFGIVGPDHGGAVGLDVELRPGLADGIDHGRRREPGGVVLHVQPLANQIRRYRFDDGEMTQQQLADKVGVTRQTIVAIEKGKYSPSLELAFRIALLFELPLEEVFSYKEEN